MLKKYLMIALSFSCMHITFNIHASEPKNKINQTQVVPAQINQKKCDACKQQICNACNQKLKQQSSLSHLRWISLPMPSSLITNLWASYHELRMQKK
jgi:hypothetical protein